MKRSWVLELVRVSGAALLIPWVVDVLQNLGMLEGALYRRPLVATPGDFLGLFLAGAHIALAAVLVSWAGGSLIAALASGRPRTCEAVPLLGSLLSTLAILVAFGWPVRPALAWKAPLLAIPAGIAIYLLLRTVSRRRQPGSWRLDEVLEHTLLPVLVAAFATGALVRPGWRRAISLTGAVAVAALWILLRRKLPSVAAFALRVSPVLAAMILALGYVVASSLHGRAPGGTPEGNSRARPHIILVVLDTVRADHLGLYGYHRDTMPALGRWAASALTVRRAIAPSGWTSPSHASIFTGKTVSEHGIHYASGRRPGGPIIRTKPYEGLPWLTTKLAEEGYQCIAVSANHMAVPPEMEGLHRRLIPSRHAWLRHGLAAMGDRLFPTSRRLSGELRWKMPYADAKATADLAMRAAPEGDRPLFLFVNFMDAHSPYNPPASALRELGARGERVFDHYWTHRDLTRQWEQLGEGAAGAVADLYDGELRWIDRHLERLLAWIDGRYGEDALVLVTSDHGEELGEKGRVGHEYGLAQSLIHVPLIVKARSVDPGTLEPVTSLVSLYGFILEAASGREPSVSILARPGIHGAISERYPSKYNSRELGEGYDRAWVSLIEGHQKAVGPSGDGFELFEIPEDAFHEEVSVADAPSAEALRQKIDDYWRDHRDVRGRPEGEEGLSEEELRRLRSLGYVQ